MNGVASKASVGAAPLPAMAEPQVDRFPRYGAFPDNNRRALLDQGGRGRPPLRGFFCAGRFLLPLYMIATCLLQKKL